MMGWGVMWHSNNRLEGDQHHLMWTPLFRTRRECREFINERWGYTRTRPDLQREPHGWRVPQAVRVEVREIKP